MLRYAFDVFSARRVIVGHAAPNTPSARIIAKLGFCDPSRTPLGSEMPGGTFVDGISYAMPDGANLPKLPATWGQGR